MSARLYGVLQTEMTSTHSLLRTKRMCLNPILSMEEAFDLFIRNNQDQSSGWDKLLIQFAQDETKAYLMPTRYLWELYFGIGGGRSESAEIG